MTDEMSKDQRIAELEDTLSQVPAADWSHCPRCRWRLMGATGTCDHCGWNEPASPTVEHQITVTEWPEARGATYGWRCTCGANTDSDLGRWALADHAVFAARRDHIARIASPLATAPYSTDEDTGEMTP